MRVFRLQIHAIQLKAGATVVALGYGLVITIVAPVVDIPDTVMMQAFTIVPLTPFVILAITLGVDANAGLKVNVAVLLSHAAPTIATDPFPCLISEKVLPLFPTFNVVSVLLLNET